jgi:thiol-disulfide isomerase/thioredoxin
MIAVLSLTAAFASVPSGAADGPAKVPVFPNFGFSSLDGSQQIDLESLRGRPVLLTFWASWCGPCRQELPELQKLAAELADTGFTLITVNTDDSPAMGTRFLQRNGIEVPVYRMSDRDLATLGVRALPTNVLLDREGRPLQIFKGYSPEVPAEIRRLVMALGAGAAGGASPPGT